MTLFLRLTLLTLLLAAPDLLVSGENMITCYGDVQHLTCGTGLIKVKSTVYGRTDNNTCNVGRPPSQVAKTDCASKIFTIAERCNGLRECEVKTNLLANPDPCYGTYKYYNTTYDCINGQFVVICEHGYSTLDCGDDSIQIINANYGRADSVTCSNGLSNSLIQNTNCYAPNTLPTVAALCNGQQRCTVEASFKLFTDPCVGTVKYLTVSYLCNREIVTCEHDTAVLTCGVRRLKIISANYGRTDSTTCSSGRPANQLTNTNCYTPSAFDKVAARCEGQNTCEVPATNSFFSDPCYGTYKYLKIVYSCVYITMLCLKLTLLSLLIAATALLASGENVVTCNEHIQQLNCDAGVISVQSSVYGRTNSKTCSANRPFCDVAHTKCALQTSIVAERCNGLKICQLKTDLLGTPDPCKGTYKYYNTTYDCLMARHTVVCEYGYSTLDCGHDNIYIMNANYGRANSQTCSNGLSSDLIKNTNCYAPDVHSTVATLCNGHQRCTVEASNSVFSDPCADTYKYLSVSYFCTRDIVVCEGDTASLFCGDRRIKVFGADYGRTDSTTCASGLGEIQISNTQCSTLDAAAKVKARCEGHHSCEVFVSNDVFSDPCPNIFKYLKVVYACV
ncbi:uncharacterized protein LOC132893497 [Neoarius graeffei]|uniref:uncharacterized protein LOC132893497 n=1 Tax=Neoarius graeffei TaxID=443677 RepID=UPI00298BFEF7|nr:uncharacterized protein LOC132893497 [Neoarius graeffei]